MKSKAKSKTKGIIPLFKNTFHQWSEDKAPRLAAALAYYTVFSLAPFLIIVIAIVGLVFGHQTAQTQIISQIESLIGHSGAIMVQDMINGALRPSTNIIAAVIGVILLLLGASGLFGQLQDALNTIWEVAPKPGVGILHTIKERFFSFTLVLGVAFLLLVSLVISAGLTALANYVIGLLPAFKVLLEVVNFIVSLGVTTFLFALLFKYLPDAKIAWRDVWLGALFTAFLFIIGHFIIGLYLGRSSIGTTYGAAASLVIILIWVYYAGQILFFGAEFTQVYANMYGSHIVPESDAEKVTEVARAEQGITHDDVKKRGAELPQNASSLRGLPATGGSAGTDQDQTMQPPDMPHTPADKSIRALEMISLALTGFVSSVAYMAARQHK